MQRWLRQGDESGATAVLRTDALTWTSWIFAEAVLERVSGRISRLT